MGGSRVDAKQEKSTNTQHEVGESQEDQEELHADIASPVEAREGESENEETFDPEAADREALVAKYRELEDQLKKSEDRLLRTAAEGENFRKRLQREKEEQTRYANEAIIRDLLPVIDNLDRALGHSQAGSEQGGLAEGLNMTLKGFLDSLARFGCTPVEAVGQAFDPNFHEAVSQEETADHESNTVIRELQKGYMLKERLLRPAMVIVSKSPSQEEDTTPKQAEADSLKREAGTVRIKVTKA